MRLLARVYAGGPTPSKVIRNKYDSLLFNFADSLQWWLSFTKRKFMGKSL